MLQLKLFFGKKKWSGFPLFPNEDLLFIILKRYWYKMERRTTLVAFVPQRVPEEDEKYCGLPRELKKI